MAASPLGVSGPCCPRVRSHLAWVRPGFAERGGPETVAAQEGWGGGGGRAPACELQELSAV